MIWNLIGIEVQWHPINEGRCGMVARGSCLADVDVGGCAGILRETACDQGEEDGILEQHIECEYLCRGDGIRKRDAMKIFEFDSSVLIDELFELVRFLLHHHRRSSTPPFKIHRLNWGSVACRIRPRTILLIMTR